MPIHNKRITKILFIIINTFYNLNILNIKGRSDLYLKLKIYEKIIIVGSLIIGFQYGIYGILFSQVVVSVVIFFLNAHYTNKFIDFSPWEQLKTIIPIISLASACGGLVLLVDIWFVPEIDIVRILSGGILGIIIYILSSWLLRMKSFMHFRSLILTYIGSGKG